MTWPVIDDRLIVQPGTVPVDCSTGTNRDCIISMMNEFKVW